ncbi:CoA transferase subunit A [Brevibacillus invocatus]|uniref:CoA transferase subunit A n=1 Tax=Brevibacillus invocatus TaxID=173959 RepID=A0A3M8CGT9_9BACL|nr:CoA transferase subunit A [Brevibacillus invocatus]RNB74976.1 CoA transferase subunit A [Brevibacillus invocatus]
MVSKLITMEEAAELIQDGIRLMYGGFGGMGSPDHLIDQILDKGVRDLTLIGNDAGFSNRGIGKLITQERVKKMLTTHIGSNPQAGRQMMEGKLEVIFFPQGILVEKIRAGGVGIPAILVEPGMGDVTAKKEQLIVYAGEKYLVEPALTADVGIVYAKQADTYGNLIYEKAARNVNPLVAMAAQTTIAEVEEIVPVGELDPESIVTPGIFVDYIVLTRGGNG